MTAPATHKFSNVVLGFLDPPPPTGFIPSDFQSKAGGRPVWLYRPPRAPPPPPRCPICLQPQRFLLQVYAPLEPEVTVHDAAFHRVLYVAICPSQSCHAHPNCASVLRAQLPRRNPHYHFEGPSDLPDVELVEEHGDACVLCGFAGVKRCGACHRVSYCSRVCQSADWKLGHKQVCGRGHDEEPVAEERRRWRFAEFEIVTDSHPTPPSSDDESSDDENDEEFRTDGVGDGPEESGQITARKVQEASRKSIEASSFSSKEENTRRAEVKGVKTSLPKEREDEPREDDSGKSASTIVESPKFCGTFQDADEEELPEELFHSRNDGTRDPAFSRFSKVVSYAADQVVRYDWDGTPLWATRKGQCLDTGKCDLCGADRVFEMQVMPQLAYFLEERDDSEELSIEQIAKRLRDDAEWGTIFVFSCSRSCEVGEDYVREFAWMQRIQG